MAIKTVTMSCPTEGARIYYTIDGSIPDQTKTLYSGAFQVDDEQVAVIQAVAYKEMMTWSDVTLAQTVPPPENPAITGTQNQPIGTGYTITITVGDNGTIHYTTDGSVPTADSPVYTEPIVVYGHKLIRAINMIDELSSMVSEYQIEGDNMRVVEIPMGSSFIGADYEEEMNYLKEHHNDAVIIKFKYSSDDGIDVNYYADNWLYDEYESGNIRSFWITILDQLRNVNVYKLTYTSSTDTYTWDTNKVGTLQFYFLE